MATNTTMLNDLINPEVVADMITAQLPSRVVFAPIAIIGDKLAGQPGNTLTVPSYTFIGVAEEVAEGAPIPLAKLSTTSKLAVIKKAAKGVELTDEAILSGYGDPIGEATNQLISAIALKVDEDCYTALKETTIVSGDGTEALTSLTLAKAIGLWGENLEGEKYCFVSNEQYVELLTEKAFIPLNNLAGMPVLVSGTVGMIYGTQIVVSSKVKAAAGIIENVLVKAGALAIENKRDTFVEQERHAQNKITALFADKHYVAYLKDESKATLIKSAAPTGAPATRAAKK